MLADAVLLRYSGQSVTVGRTLKKEQLPQETYT
jgi:hypothetical protein